MGKCRVKVVEQSEELSHSGVALPTTAASPTLIASAMERYPSTTCSNTARGMVTVASAFAASFPYHCRQRPMRERRCRRFFRVGEMPVNQDQFGLSPRLCSTKAQLTLRPSASESPLNKARCPAGRQRPMSVLSEATSALQFALPLLGFRARLNGSPKAYPPENRGWRPCAAYTSEPGRLVPTRCRGFPPNP